MGAAAVAGNVGYSNSKWFLLLVLCHDSSRLMMNVLDDHHVYWLKSSSFFESGEKKKDTTMIIVIVSLSICAIIHRWEWFCSARKVKKRIDRETLFHALVVDHRDDDWNENRLAVNVDQSSENRLRPAHFPLSLFIQRSNTKKMTLSMFLSSVFLHLFIVCLLFWRNKKQIVSIQISK